MLFIEVPFHIIQENPIIIEIWKKAFNNSQANFDLPELGGVGVGLVNWIHILVSLLQRMNLKRELNEICEWKITIWSQRWFKWFDQTISLNNQPKRMAGRFHNQHFDIHIFPFLLRIHWRTQARTHTRSLLCQCFWILNSLQNLIFNLPIQCDVLENSMQKLLPLISFMHTHTHAQTHTVENTHAPSS